jgi:Sortase and related acyltransferases
LRARTIEIRRARREDASALLNIYRDVVESTAVSFELIVPSEEQFAARIEDALRHWQWLVAIDGTECIGYAYGSSHRKRGGYRWSTEVSAYVRQDCHREGIGRTLYTQLFEDLAELGYCNAYAGVTLPNPASVAFHESLGFQAVGVFSRVGRKFGKWHDVAWFQRVLRDEPAEEPES